MESEALYLVALVVAPVGTVSSCSRVP